MATAKIATLIIRTLAKPISSKIKEQARQHERFRGMCVELAQFLYRSEVKLRTNVLGEPARHVRPLSETKAIENGANFIAEGFLFSVATALIIGETWRSSRNQTKRKESVDDQLEELAENVQALTSRMNGLVGKFEDSQRDERQRNDELERILERVVEIGLRGGWAEFQDAPVQLPLVRLGPNQNSSLQPPSTELDSTSPSSTSTSTVLSSIPDLSATFKTPPPQEPSEAVQSPETSSNEPSSSVNRPSTSGDL